MKYRKKPVVVEAEQWFPGKEIPGVNPPMRGDDRFYVVTIHGQQAFLDAGDWIIVEPDKVHHYLCKPDVFVTNYDLEQPLYCVVMLNRIIGPMTGPEADQLMPRLIATAAKIRLIPFEEFTAFLSANPDYDNELHHNASERKGNGH